MTVEAMAFPITTSKADCASSPCPKNGLIRLFIPPYSAPLRSRGQTRNLDLIPALASCCTDDRAWIAKRMALAGARKASVSARDLLEPQTIRPIVDQFAELYRDCDRRAVASFWTQWYFLALVTPTVAAALCLGRVLPVDIGEIGLAIDPSGRPDAIVIDHEGFAPPHGAAPVFDKLIANNMEPMIFSMCQSFGVSPRVLWSNAGTILEWAVGQFAPLAIDATALAEGRTLLQQRELAGGLNPLYEPVRYIDDDGEQIRRRRVCCLRYRLDGVANCGRLCPLPSIHRAAR